MLRAPKLQNSTLIRVRIISQILIVRWCRVIARRGSVAVVGVDTSAGDGRAHLIGDTKFAFELLEVRRGGGGICSRSREIISNISRASGRHRIDPNAPMDAAIGRDCEYSM